MLMRITEYVHFTLKKTCYSIIKLKLKNGFKKKKVVLSIIRSKYFDI